jgi:hypothetical protein
MTRNGWLVFLTVLLSAVQMEGRDRGHASAGRFALFRQPGAIMRQGIRGYGPGRPGAFGFGGVRPGSGVRWSWPLYGSGLGVYYSAPLQAQDYDAAPDAENQNSPPIYYYQEPVKPDVMPDCKDAWATKSSSSSLSHFMNRVFELQCQNRHPEAKGKPSRAPSELNLVP